MARWQGPRLDLDSNSETPAVPSGGLLNEDLDIEAWLEMVRGLHPKVDAVRGKPSTGKNSKRGKAINTVNAERKKAKKA